MLRLQAGAAAGLSQDTAGSLLFLERLSVCTPASNHVICRWAAGWLPGKGAGGCAPMQRSALRAACWLPAHPAAAPPLQMPPARCPAR